ncbi:hypothetical protein [Caenispirillum bisanense]|uniref:Uncharacterized protein n=1 Tax=Caenispirillum bisanense TaxID=414052 RepID=A0A286GN98_9PROT|nr:hypothetical protein [Caenispirillum bisanense]SOD97007.1 hypothetical protein SAMN05421508_106204 [Caenispirillum bisanense]
MSNISDFLRSTASGDVIRTFTSGIHGDVKAGDVLAANRLSGVVAAVPPIQDIGETPTGARVLPSAATVAATSMPYYGMLSTGERVFTNGSLSSTGRILVVDPTGAVVASETIGGGTGYGHIVVDGDEIVVIVHNGSTACLVKVFDRNLTVLRSSVVTTGTNTSPMSASESSQIVPCADVYVIIWHNSSANTTQWASINKTTLALVQSPTTFLSGAPSSHNWTIGVRVDAGWLYALSYQISSTSYVAGVFVNYTTGTPYISAGASNCYFSGNVGTTEGPPVGGTVKRALIKRNGTAALFLGSTGTSNISQVAVAGDAVAPTLTMSTAGHNSNAGLFHEDANYVYCVVAVSGSMYVYTYSKANNSNPSQSNLGSTVYIANPALGVASGNEILVMDAQTTATIAASFKFTMGGNGTATLSSPLLSGNVQFPRALFLQGRTAIVVYGRGWLGSSTAALRYLTISLDTMSETSSVELLTGNNDSNTVFPSEGTNWIGSSLVFGGPIAATVYTPKHPSTSVTTPFRFRPGGIAAVGVAKTDSVGGAADVQLAGWADLNSKYAGYFGSLDHTSAGGNKVSVFGRNAKIGE